LGDVHQYPALNTQGISHVRLDFGVGGVIPPHIHPLATETLFVVQGSIYTGFISYDNVLYAEVLQQGDVFIFPRASLHFQINVGTGPAVTFNSLNSQDPGFLLTANQLLATNISSAVLEASLGINSQELYSLQASVPSFWSHAAPWSNLQGALSLSVVVSVKTYNLGYLSLSSPKPILFFIPHLTCLKLYSPSDTTFLFLSEICFIATVYLSILSMM